MSSFTALLRVNRRHYPVTRFTTAFSQETTSRGRVAAKVRHGTLDIELDVPAEDHLLQWAAAAHQALAGALVVLDGTGQASEYIAFQTGYCVQYHELFRAGDQQTGAYHCRLRLADPAGFRLGSGNPAALAPPAARDHGTPPVAPAASTTPPPLPGTASTCPPDVTARLQGQVMLACKTQKSRCTGENTCAELAARIPVGTACVAARKAIMVQCYGGGDSVHRDELSKAERALERCTELYLKKCGPLPQPSPVPSRQPDTDPQTQKPNPSGLVGTALLLYLLLELGEALLILI